MNNKIIFHHITIFFKIKMCIRGTRTWKENGIDNKYKIVTKTRVTRPNICLPIHASFVVCFFPERWSWTCGLTLRASSGLVFQCSLKQNSLAYFTTPKVTSETLSVDFRLFINLGLNSLYPATRTPLRKFLPEILILIS